ncbi:MAG: flagellar hook-basal body complex protein FliE [Peptostreptococcaceae bacterium]|nr:flagellar hook-basal body complex protein FliE [Peptostreptococcaceae bacterium]
MRIESLLNVGIVSGDKSLGADKATSFSETMRKQLEEVNELQIQSEKNSEALALGETDDIHNVLIQGEEARLALEMTVQVRNKVIEAYQEIMKMQI